MNKYDLKTIKNIDIAKRVSYGLKKEYYFEGFFMDDEIFRAS